MLSSDLNIELVYCSNWYGCMGVWVHVCRACGVARFASVVIDPPTWAFGSHGCGFFHDCCFFVCALFFLRLERLVHMAVAFFTTAIVFLLSAAFIVCWMLYCLLVAFMCVVLNSIVGRLYVCCMFFLNCQPLLCCVELFVECFIVCWHVCCVEFNYRPLLCVLYVFSLNIIVCWPLLCVLCVFSSDLRVEFNCLPLLCVLYVFSSDY